MSEQKYYKLVRNVRGRYFSYNAHLGKYTQEYSPEEWTAADFGGLFAFKSLEEARETVYRSDLNVECWEAEVGKEIPFSEAYFRFCADEWSINLIRGERRFCNEANWDELQAEYPTSVFVDKLKLVTRIK